MSNGGTNVGESPLNDRDVLLDGLERFLFFDATVREERSKDTPGSGIIREDRPLSVDVVGLEDQTHYDEPPPSLAPSAEEEAVVELRRGTFPRQFPPRQSTVDY